MTVEGWWGLSCKSKPQQLLQLVLVLLPVVQVVVQLHNLLPPLPLLPLRHHLAHGFKFPAIRPSPSTQLPVVKVAVLQGGGGQDGEHVRGGHGEVGCELWPGSWW
jgi:hypothetical protein